MFFVWCTASLVIGFETVDDKDTTNIYGKAPKDALVALLAHRAPGLYLELRSRMMGGISKEDDTNEQLTSSATKVTKVTKEEIRQALMSVGAYWSTPAKPAARQQKEYSEQARTLGNVAFKAKDWLVAATHYSQALDHLSGGSTNVHDEDKDMVGRILSNRSAARCNAGQHHLAAYDAFEIVLDLLPAWPKSYLRLGKACESMGGHGDAKTWYEW